MKKIGFIIFIAALLIGVVLANFTSFGKAESGLINFSFNKGVRGSGNVVSETRDLRDFKAVEVGGIFKVEIVAQKDFGVQVEADDNLLPLIRTEVNNGVLEISTEKRFKSKNRITVRIAAPEIDTSGASKVTLGGTARELMVEVSGASKIDAEGLQSENATIEASGASKVAVNVTGRLKADCSGASSVTYKGSPVNVDSKTSGASRVESGQ